MDSAPSDSDRIRIEFRIKSRSRIKVSDLITTRSGALSMRRGSFRVDQALQIIKIQVIKLNNYTTNTTFRKKIMIKFQ